MDAPQIVTLLIAGGSALGVLLAYFKYKPGQRERVEQDTAQGQLNVAQGNLNIAQGSINLVTSTLEGQFTRMAARMEAMDIEAAEYQSAVEGRLSELSTELRAEKIEKERVKQENARLKVRVDELEAEVKHLKARQT